MRILMIGGSKFIGKQITDLATQHGHTVCTFNRGITDPRPGTNRIVGDIENLLHYKAELLDFRPDIVVHCIAYTEKHARDCVEVFAGTSARILVLSSVDCYEAFQALVRGNEVSDFPVDESMPTTPIRYYWRGSGHELAEWYDKNLVTDIFLRAFHEGLIYPTIFRLPMVYGPEDYQFGYRHGDIIQRIIDQKVDFPMSSLEQGQVFTYGYVENIGAAIVHAFSLGETTTGKIYNLGELKVRSRRRWAELYANRANWTFNFLTVPIEVGKNPSPPSWHLIFDCTKYHSDTGFIPPVTLQEGIDRTLKWARKHQPSL